MAAPAIPAAAAALGSAAAPAAAGATAAALTPAAIGAAAATGAGAASTAASMAAGTAGAGMSALAPTLGATEMAFMSGQIPASGLLATPAMSVAPIAPAAQMMTPAAMGAPVADLGMKAGMADMLRLKYGPQALNALSKTNKAMGAAQALAPKRQAPAAVAAAPKIQADGPAQPFSASGPAVGRQQILQALARRQGAGRSPISRMI